jgi:hypothetical protein
MSDLKSAKI